MKVIKAGIVPSMEVTCKICGAILEIESRDLTAQGSSNPPSFFLYTCPCCNRNNGIHLHDLSPSLRKEVMQLFK